MKILIDECLPRKLKNELLDHEVTTVPQAGWAGKKNGELLQLMIDEFDVFITIDGNLSYQQNLEGVSMAFVILIAKNNRLDTLLPLMTAVNIALKTIKSGDFVRVEE